MALLNAEVRGLMERDDWKNLGMDDVDKASDTASIDSSSKK
jgi:hypothetical protein